MNLALFDLDHTLLPLDSDYEWGQFLLRIGAVNEEFTERNEYFFAQYKTGTLNPVEYLDFALGTLARFPRQQLDQWHRQFMEEVIQPAILPNVLALVQRHHDAGNLVAIVTATNRFVAEPIARLFGVEHLIAAEPEFGVDNAITGKLIGLPTFGAAKVTHTHAWLDKMKQPLSSFARSYFYSDSHNDIPLLSAVTHPVATNPNLMLDAHAKAHGWPILMLFDD